MLIKRSCIILCLTVYGLYVLAQDVTLPSLEEMEESITNYTMQERTADLKAFEVGKTAEWQELLPSIGVAYTPSGSPRPSANWSPLQFLDRKDKKKKRSAEQSAIQLKYELVLYDRLHKLRQQYRDYQMDLAMQGVDDESVEIDEKLFAIEKEKYAQHIIKPSEFLKAKKKILDLRAKTNIEKMKLEKKKYALLYESRWKEQATTQLYNKLY